MKRFHRGQIRCDNYGILVCTCQNPPQALHQGKAKRSASSGEESQFHGPLLTLHHLPTDLQEHQLGNTTGFEPAWPDRSGSMPRPRPLSLISCQPSPGTVSLPIPQTHSRKQADRNAQRLRPGAVELAIQVPWVYPGPVPATGLTPQQSTSFRSAKSNTLAALSLQPGLRSYPAGRAISGHHTPRSTLEPGPCRAISFAPTAARHPSSERSPAPINRCLRVS